MLEFVIEHSYLIPLLPLIGAAAAGFFGARHLKQNSHWPIWLGVGVSALLSIALLLGMLSRWREAGHGEGHAAAGNAAQHATAGGSGAGEVEGGSDSEEQPIYTSSTLAFRKYLYTWIRAGERQVRQVDTSGRPVSDNAGLPVMTRKPAFFADAAFFFDPLTAVMLCVVCGIGFLITVFAKGYMAGEEGYFRFFAYLGLFIFMMTILVMGDNLVMLYLGWEGVGLCSYLLIGYYYERPAAREASKKAFLVNRVGDFGFGIGIMLSFLAFGTVSFFGQGVGTNTGIIELAMNPQTPLQQWAVSLMPFCLMVGAF